MQIVNKLSTISHEELVKILPWYTDYIAVEKNNIKVIFAYKRYDLDKCSGQLIYLYNNKVEHRIPFLEIDLWDSMRVNGRCFSESLLYEYFGLRDVFYNGCYHKCLVINVIDSNGKKRLYLLNEDCTDLITDDDLFECFYENNDADNCSLFIRDNKYVWLDKEKCIVLPNNYFCDSPVLKFTYFYASNNKGVYLIHSNQFVDDAIPVTKDIILLENRYYKIYSTGISLYSHKITEYDVSKAKKWKSTSDPILGIYLVTKGKSKYIYFNNIKINKIPIIDIKSTADDVMKIFYKDGTFDYFNIRYGEFTRETHGYTTNINHIQLTEDMIANGTYKSELGEKKPKTSKKTNSSHEKETKKIEPENVVLSKRVHICLLYKQQ